MLTLLEYVPEWAAYGGRHPWLVRGEQGPKNKKTRYKNTAGFLCALWCPGPESNRHALRRGILSPVRLPIPPPGRRYLTRPKLWHI